MNNSDLSSSGQMLQQLELERAKSEFLEEELDDITFTFQSSPPVLTLSENGAKRLGINRVISDPHESVDIKDIENESLKQLLDELAHTTAENSAVNMSGQILADGKMTDCTFRCRTLWMTAEKPIYIGATGRILCR
ncbi:MAG: hypothetical protein J6C96_11885 [Oscillospiraceae bacterium]|nr:hypothetical protein [Oscillospiraceae bacterium]